MSQKLRSGTGGSERSWRMPSTPAQTTRAQRQIGARGRVGDAVFDIELLRRAVASVDRADADAAPRSRAATLAQVGAQRFGRSR